MDTIICIIVKMVQMLTMCDFHLALAFMLLIMVSDLSGFEIVLFSKGAAFFLKIDWSRFVFLTSKLTLAS